MNGHGPKRAILCARVSTDEQARSGYSLSQQLEALREYAAREGYEILDEVIDPGKSGPTLDRPGLDRVRDFKVTAGGVTAVLAQDRDRFAREPAYLWVLREELREHGCKLRLGVVPSEEGYHATGVLCTLRPTPAYGGHTQKSSVDTMVNGGRIECESQPQPVVLVRLPVGGSHDRPPDNPARTLAGVAVRPAAPL